jgi:hypothetical protein
VLRAFALFALAALPLRAASLKPGTPALSLRLEGIFGQPTGLLGVRGGGGFGLGYRLSDQLAIVGDVAQRAAPGGGISSLAFGIQATLDATPIAPYLEVAVVDLGPQRTLGYSLATRTGLGADYRLSRSWLFGLVVRTLIAVDADSDKYGNLVTTGGTEAALRFTYLPGAN